MTDTDTWTLVSDAIWQEGARCTRITYVEAEVLGGLSDLYVCWAAGDLPGQPAHLVSADAWRTPREGLAIAAEHGAADLVDNDWTPGERTSPKGMDAESRLEAIDRAKRFLIGHKRDRCTYPPEAAAAKAVARASSGLASIRSELDQHRPKGQARNERDEIVDRMFDEGLAAISLAIDVLGRDLEPVD